VGAGGTLAEPAMALQFTFRPLKVVFLGSTKMRSVCGAVPLDGGWSATS
jgi:hypothetical protein